jgi:hypothetical protein
MRMSLGPLQPIDDLPTFHEGACSPALLLCVDGVTVRNNERVDVLPNQREELLRAVPLQFTSTLEPLHADEIVRRCLGTN